MKTLTELEEFLRNTDKGLISIDYVLIDSLNYPDIDKFIRQLRIHLMDFSNKINSMHDLLTNGQIFRINEANEVEKVYK